MCKKLCLFAGSCGLVLLALGAVPSGAQSAIKEKPAMYTYVADWQIPRAHWGDMAKASSEDKPILDKALADGTIIGYGSDESLVHQVNAPTHNNWWSAMSMAGLIKVLDQFMAPGGNTSNDATTSATSHEDSIYVSHYYNWHPGAYKNGYTEISGYKLKADAPDDAIDTLSKNLVAPLLEKLLADGTILEYEVDELAVHTQAPGSFWIAYIAAKPDGLDKVNAAIVEVLKSSPFSGPAFGSMTDYTSHRDELIKGDGIYK